MTEQTLNKSLKILLINDQLERTTQLVEIINNGGYELSAILSSASGLLHQIEKYHPDIVLIELQRGENNLLSDLKIIKQHHPIPLVMISDNDDPEYLEKAVNAGVTTYLLKDFNLLRIKPIIDLAIARFKSYQSLRSALNDAETKLESESIIFRAKKMLMEKHKISEDNAHKTLRTLSMDTNLSLPEAARSTINILSKK